VPVAGLTRRWFIQTNTPDNVIVFRVISHVDIGSELKDEFPGWKAGLNEQLV
jgi:hypothetical protein